MVINIAATRELGGCGRRRTEHMSKRWIEGVCTRLITILVGVQASHGEGMIMRAHQASSNRSRVEFVT